MQYGDSDFLPQWKVWRLGCVTTKGTKGTKGTKVAKGDFGVLEGRGICE